MRITELFQNGRPFPSLEIVPPLGGMTKEDLLSSIEPLMEFSPRYINVTTHRDEFSFEKQADGSFRRRIVNSRVSPVAVCACIQARFPVEVVPHIICGGQTATDIRRQLQDFRFMGIDNVMALRGDSTIGEKRFTPTEEGYTHASQLVSAIHEEGPFCVGVGGYPEKHFEAPNMETDIANLKKKVDAGADYIITQMFFDNQVFFRFEKLCREAGITVPIIPGLKPLTSRRQVKVLPETFSIDLPLALTEAVEKAGEHAEEVRLLGIQWCIDQCRELLSSGVPAVHFYTMSRSDSVAQVLRSCF
jgi:methylenetetrahydrofolate reductase (NADPH)